MFNFVFPEFCVCFWQPEKLAVFVTMPKTSVYKNHRIVVRKKNVGCADVTLVIFAESETCLEKRFSQKHFGFCVFAVNF